MKKCYVAIIICIMAICFIAPQAMASILIESWNADAAPANALFGNTQLAWKYTPTSTYDLSRVEFYTATVGTVARDMTIQLRADDNNEVGSILTSGTFNQSTIRSWQGTDLTSYTVTEGQTYWVAFWDTNNSTWAHITFDPGVTIDLRVGGDHNPDNYPSLIAGTYKPMAKFYGTPSESSVVPEPATMALFGIGSVAMTFIRKKKKAA